MDFSLEAKFSIQVYMTDSSPRVLALPQLCSDKNGIQFPYCCLQAPPGACWWVAGWEEVIAEAISCSELFHGIGMETSRPRDLVGEMGAKELLNLHLSGPSLARRGGVTWQQDTAGNWIRRLEAAAARSEARSRAHDAQHTTASRASNLIKVPRNQQQLHKELLFTHRKGLSLRSKPELLQVLELRNRRRDGTESCVEQTPLERELLRWQQRREQRQQQEATADTVGDQPEFIRVRDNLRRTQCSRDPLPQCVTPSAISSPSLRSHFTHRLPPGVPGTLSPPAEVSQRHSSLEASSLSSASSQCTLSNS